MKNTEKHTYNGYTIEIINDNQPENPRTANRNLGTLVCWHKRGNYGDEMPTIGRAEYFAKIVGIDLDNEPVIDLDAIFARLKETAVYLPVYMLVHSGVVIQTTPFNDRWDSGLLGYIYVLNETLKAVEVNGTEEEIKEILKAEIATYENYVTGEVYGCNIYNPDGEEIKSFYGYFGSNHEESGLLPAAKEWIDSEIAK